MSRKTKSHFGRHTAWRISDRATPHTRSVSTCAPSNPGTTYHASGRVVSTAGTANAAAVTGRRYNTLSTAHREGPRSGGASTMGSPERTRATLAHSPLKVIGVQADEEAPVSEL